MHRRYEHTNIPIELLRTLVVITDVGSFSEAARALGVSQAAVSSQVKRLQLVVGGPVFAKTMGGLTLTDRGKLVKRQAQAILEANDRILALSGSLTKVGQLRIGISIIFAEAILNNPAMQNVLLGTNVWCDTGEELSKGLADGYIDVACIISPSPELFHCEYSWTEQIIWLKAPEFTLSPLDPIPLVGCPEMLIDRIAISHLERQHVGFEMVFSTPHVATRLSAIRAGLGCGVFVERFAPKDIKAARMSSLPGLPSLTAGIYTSTNADREKVKPVIDALTWLRPAEQTRRRA